MASKMKTKTTAGDKTEEADEAATTRTRRPRTPRVAKRVPVVHMQALVVGDIVWHGELRGIVTRNSVPTDPNARVLFADDSEALVSLYELMVERK